MQAEDFSEIRCERIKWEREFGGRMGWKIGELGVQA